MVENKKLESVHLHQRNTVDEKLVFPSRSGLVSGCSGTTLAGTVYLHVSSISHAEQGHSETSSHSDWLRLSQPWFPYLIQLCVDQPQFLPYGQDLLSQPGYTLNKTSYYLQAWRHSCSTSNQQDLPKRSLGSLQHLEDSQQMYDDRWLPFSSWAAEQGIDLLGSTPAQVASFLFSLIETNGLSPQMAKGCMSCLTSVLSCTGKADVVHDRNISDIKSFMEIERPRPTTVLPEWDLVYPISLYWEV